MLYSSFAQQMSLLSALSKTSAPNKWVLALSGGLDSRVLLHLLARYKQETPEAKIQAIYVNHGLSPNANEWANACDRFCQQDAMTFSCDIDFNEEKVSLDLNAKGGVEHIARTARYQALEKYIDENSVLLTAQHATDQMETFLLALKRGSGVTGLSAMPKQRPFSNGVLFRPLLDVSQVEIQQYGQVHQLDWVEDESNNDDRFDRNFIRHQVTPILAERWPHIESAIGRTAQLCAEQDHLLNELLDETRQQLQSADMGLSIEGLSQKSAPARHAIIRQWLAVQNFPMPSAKQLATLWQEVALAQEDAAPKLNYAEVQIGRFNQHLYAFKKLNDVSQIQLEWNIEQALILPDGLGELRLVDVKDRNDIQPNAQLLSLPTQVIESKKIMVIFSLEALSLKNIKIDKKVKPENRAHSRSLKKLLQEYQVPTWQRKRLPILVTNVNENAQLIAIAALFVTDAYGKNNQDNASIYQLVWGKQLVWDK